MSPDNTALVILPAEAGSSLLEAAEMEFQATLQLLTDRACWVSCAASGEIALYDHGELRYAAISGASEYEPGMKVATQTDPIHECLAEQRLVRRRIEPGTACLVAPIVQDGKASGFLNLTSGNEFSDEAAALVSRTAELLSVALQHRDAAERAAKLEFRDDELDLPSLWSAPEDVPPKGRTADPEVAIRSQTAVRTCAACGFPISPTRSLCVECERKPEASAVAANSLFQPEPDENWLSAHGYTIASLVVTVLTAALLLWLRH